MRTEPRLSERKSNLCASFWAQIGFFIFILLILNDEELKYCARLGKLACFQKARLKWKQASQATEGRVV